MWELGLAVVPLVSVVIPTFNRKSKVFLAIESVERQAYPALEIIVVDDASTDGTAEAIAGRPSPVPVRVVRLPVNRGPSGARNAGIALASGNYVAFLDSDDRWLPGKVRRQVEVAEQAANRAGVLVYSRTQIIRRYDEVVRPRRLIGELEPVADYLFANGGYLAQSVVMVSTALARAVPFRDMVIHEDWDWYIRLQSAGAGFVMLPEVHCIVDDRGVEGRQSHGPVHVSLSVLESLKPSISPRAYLALRAKLAPLLRETAAARAMQFIMEAYRHGAIDHWQLCMLIGRLAHPRLRDAAYWLHGACATVKGRVFSQSRGGD